MRVRASTLIESIVALTIIAIVFSASLITFNAVTGVGNGQTKLVVHQMLQEVTAATKQEKRYTDETWDKGGFQFSKQVIRTNEKGLILLTISAKSDNGKLLEKHEEYILEDENN